ncbi:hypothetical protein, partial [Mycobacterium leprae]|uniref:hypothetical protein n=1 Tax=Mycobacterium leprae TaxID=1769 RepID=UPI000AF10861
NPNERLTIDHINSQHCNTPPPFTPPPQQNMHTKYNSTILQQVKLKSGRISIEWRLVMVAVLLFSRSRLTF